MDFYEEASLVMVPSGYKDQKVYSSVPDDGSGDLTFSRASTATRVNSDGYIEKAQVNLLLQSNTFNTTWLNQLGGTITGGQSGYDGTNDAWLLSKDTSTFRSIRQVISFAGVVTYSAYVKAGTLSNAALRVDSSAGALQVLYDLSAGTATLSGGANIAYGIDSIGSGWYRIFVTANISGGTNVHVYVDRDGTTAGNILIQDAQLNYGLVAQDYIETTTASVTEGVAIDVPRLNYNPVNPTCPSLLLEPSRTNVVTQSEYAANTLQNVTASYVESPEGVNNALRLTENSSTGQHYAEFNANVVSGTTYTISFFCKEGSYSQFAWPTQGSYMTGSISVDFDTETASVTGSDMISGSAFMEPYANGWYRVGFSGVPKISGNMDMYISISPNGVGSYTGDGVSYTDFYGFQCEAGSYPTSYIPTYGSSATRTADACSKTGISSLIGQTEGTLYWEVDFGVNATTDYPALFLWDGTSTNRMLIQRRGNNDKLQFQVIVGGATQVDAFSSTSVGAGKVKIAIAYKANDFVLYLNGNQEATDTSGTTYSGALSQLAFQNTRHDQTSAVLLFKTRLSNASLSELTSL